MKRILLLIVGFGLVSSTPVLACEQEKEVDNKVCILEYNEDGTIKNEEEYLNCLDELNQVMPAEGKLPDHKG